MSDRLPVSDDSSPSMYDRAKESASDTLQRLKESVGSSEEESVEQENVSDEAKSVTKRAEDEVPSGDDQNKPAESGDTIQDMASKTAEQVIVFLFLI